MTTWLMKKKIDFESIPLRMKASRAVGVPYTDEQIASAIEDAERQAQDLYEVFLQDNGGPYANRKGETIDLSDKQVVAMIAYLHRLGTDLVKPAPTLEGEPEAEPAVEETETVAADADEQLSEAR